MAANANTVPADGVGVARRVLNGLLPQTEEPRPPLYAQTGVTAKVSSGDGSTSSATGTLYVLQHDGAAAGNCYITWIAKTDPPLLADLDHQLPLALDGGALRLFPLTDVHKVCRKINLRSLRMLVIHRRGQPNPDSPWTFVDGGAQRFVEVLQAFLKLAPQPGRSDDLIVVGTVPTEPPPAPNVAIAATESPNAQSAAATRSAKPQGAAGYAVASLMTSLGAVISEGKSMLTDTIQLMAHQSPPYPFEVHDKSAPAAEVPSTAAADAGGDDEFDFADAVVPVEHIVPIIKAGPHCPTLGPPLCETEWRACFDEAGMLIASKFADARELAFHGGICTDIRGEVWGHLLNVYPAAASLEERARKTETNETMYRRLRAQWQSVDADQASRWSTFREHRVGIEKDVARTDRTHPLFLHDSAPALCSLQRVLMTYAMYNFDVGYCQGMSDLCASLLLAIGPVPMQIDGGAASDAADDRAEARLFSYFARLMDKCEGNFHSDEKRHTIGRQLHDIGLIVQVFIPTLHKHLTKHHAEDMTFCFRWLLVLFKREFPAEHIHFLWDIILSCPFTDRFEVFVCCGLLRAVCKQVCDHELQHDELLCFTNSMSGNMRVADVVALAQEFYYDVAAAVLSWQCTEQTQSVKRPDVATVLAYCRAHLDSVTGGAGPAARDKQRPASP